MTGWVVLAIAVLLTLATAYRVEDVSIEKELPELGWTLTGVVALLAVAAWIAGFVLVRMTGWVLAILLTLLTAAGLYGGFSGDTEWPVLVSILALPAWAAAIIWRRKRPQQ